MSVPLFNERRLQLLDMLPVGWSGIIEQRYLAEGAKPMSDWPDETDIYSGTDEEALAALKRNGLVSDEIREFFSEFS